MEVWEFPDTFLTSHRYKMILNNLQSFQDALCDGCEFISAAVEHNERTVITVCESLHFGFIHRTVWDVTKKYYDVIRKDYPIGGVK